MQLTQEIHKYRGIVFYMFIVAFAWAILGVGYFKNAYYIFSVGCLIFCALKFLQMCFILAYATFKYFKAMKTFKKHIAENFSCTKKIIHAVVIPNCNEEKQVLRETLTFLASHSRAMNYCIILGMEKHEMNSQDKAKQLIQQFGSKFYLLTYTVHQTQEGQSKSKASNINFCARNMVPKLLERGINMDDCFVTVMDCDSLIPQAYMDQVETEIESNYEKRHNFIFQPPQYFTKNEKEVAFFVRIMDNLMSIMHCSNLFSICGYTLGVSNYTVSYRILERVDFWDTCVYSRCEDIRFPAKAIWKSNGQVKTYPIYVPINQRSLETHQGLFSDFKARMLQAHRNCQDQVEVGYNFACALKSKVSILKKFHMMYTICEPYIMTAFIPIPAIILIFQELVPILPKAQIDTINTFVIYSNVNTCIVLLMFAIWEALKFFSSRDLYQIKPLGLFYCVQVPLLQIPMSLLFGFYPMLSTAISVWKGNMIFTVTPKRKSLLSSQKSLDKPEKSIMQSDELEAKELISDSSIITKNSIEVQTD